MYRMAMNAREHSSGESEIGIYNVIRAISLNSKPALCHTSTKHIMIHIIISLQGGRVSS